jgi:hypothetical protein
MSKKSRKSQSVTVEAPVVVSDVVATDVLTQAEVAEVAAELPEAEVATDAPAEVVHPILAIASAAVAAPEADASSKKKYPRVGGKCWQVWNACDELRAAGMYVTVKHARDIAIERNWNVSNASQEFYAWRKFHSIA